MLEKQHGNVQGSVDLTHHIQTMARLRTVPCDVTVLTCILPEQSAVRTFRRASHHAGTDGLRALDGCADVGHAACLCHQGVLQLMSHARRSYWTLWLHRLCYEAYTAPSTTLSIFMVLDPVCYHTGGVTASSTFCQRTVFDTGTGHRA
jgi:hypothetical protein